MVEKQETTTKRGQFIIAFTCIRIVRRAGDERQVSFHGETNMPVYQTTCADRLYHIRSRDRRRGRGSSKEFSKKGGVPLCQSQDSRHIVTLT